MGILNPVGSATNAFQHAGKVHKKAEKLYTPIKDIVNNLNDTFSPAAELVRFPKHAFKVSAAGSLFCSIDLLFGPIRLAKAAYTVLFESGPVKKARAALETVKESALIGLNATGVLGALKVIGLVSSRVLPFTSKAAPFLLPFVFVTLPFQVADTISLNSLRRKIQGIKDAREGLHFVQKNHEMLSDKLSLSKKCELQKRALELENNFDPAKAERFMQILGSRVRLLTALEALDLAAGITTLACSIIALTAAPITPAVLPSILLATGITGVALWVLKSVLVQKNPFDPSTSLYRRAFSIVREKVAKLTA